MLHVGCWPVTSCDCFVAMYSMDYNTKDPAREHARLRRYFRFGMGQLLLESICKSGHPNGRLVRLHCKSVLEKQLLNAGVDCTNQPCDISTCRVQIKQNKTHTHTHTLVQSSLWTDWEFPVFHLRKHRGVGSSEDLGLAPGLPLARLVEMFATACL